jgi:hypothetical protein
MTSEELNRFNSLPERPATFGLKWREDADPIGYWDENDVRWDVFRDNAGALVRSKYVSLGEHMRSRQP